MIWQNPWAWLGLVALAVPVLIHLLARRSARVLPFPSLRFLQASQLLHARRARLSDLPILLVRIGILAAAVAALAQPFFLTASRTRELGRALARAIVVDTSASMQRAAPAGARVIDQARRDAQRIAAEAATSVIVESAMPGRALDGAVAWLATQPGRREVVVISDFQRGAIESSQVALLPAEVGVVLERIGGATEAPLESVRRFGDTETVARITLVEGRTEVEWTARSAAIGDAPLVILAGAAEREPAEAALRAARSVSPAGADPARGVAIVFPGYEQRAALLRAALPLNEPWMGNVLARVGADSMVTGVVRANVEGRERLVLLTRAAPGSLASATLMAVTLNALANTPPTSELDPEVLSDDVLTRMQRPPASAATPRPNESDGTSDGRWFWLLALVLLGAETWLRRARRVPSDVRTSSPRDPTTPSRERSAANEAVNERVA